MSHPNINIFFKTLLLASPRSAPCRCSTTWKSVANSPACHFFLLSALLGRLITHCCVPVTEAQRKKINKSGSSRSLSEWMPLLLLSSLLLERGTAHINLRSFLLTWGWRWNVVKKWLLKVQALATRLWVFLKTHFQFQS